MSSGIETRSRCQPVPSARVIDPMNLGEKQIASHRDAFAKACYLEMHGNSNNASRTSSYTGASRKLSKLLRVLSDDEDEEDGHGDGRASSSTVSLGESWLEDFRGYLNSTDQLGKLMIVQWWGVSYSSLHSVTNYLMTRTCNH